MRVLHVNKYLYRRGGAEGYLLDVAALQERSGDEVAFFGMQHPDNLPGLPLASTFPPYVELEPPPGGLAGLRAAARMVWSPRSADGLRQAVEQFRPDVVHCHNIYHQLSPSILRPVRAARIPVVMTLHDYKLACPNYQLLDHGRPCEACVGHGTWHAMRRRCKSDSLGASTLLTVESGIHRAIRAYDGVDLFVCPSRFMLAVMRRQGIAAERLTQVNNYADVPTDVRATRPGRGLVVAGRLSHEKGVDVLIEAMALAPAGLHLEVAGEGPERAALTALAERVAPGRVTFHGRLAAPQLRELVVDAIALVVPSRWYENQPMTILEAYAAAVPVVVTDLGGMPELVTPGQTGVVVPPGDPVALAEALGRLAADPVGAHAMGVTARERFLADFSAETHLRRLREAYATAGRRAARRGRRVATTGAQRG